MGEAARLVVRHGGSCSGEHGDGRARSELLPIMYSAELIEVFAGIKDVFDPDDLLNPGVLVRPAPIDADLRRPKAPAAAVDRRIPVPRRRRGFHHGGAPLRRRREMPRRLLGGRADSCAPHTWRPRTRRTSPAAARGCCRRWTNGSAISATGPLPRCTTPWTCACPARPARRLPGRRRHGPVQVRGGLPGLPAAAAAALATTHSASCRALGPAGRRRARLANALLRIGPLATAVLAAGGMDTRRAIPSFAEVPFRRSAAVTRPSAAQHPRGRPRVPTARSCCGPTRSATPSTRGPQAARPRC